MKKMNGLFGALIAAGMLISYGSAAQQAPVHTPAHADCDTSTSCTMPTPAKADANAKQVKKQGKKAVDKKAGNKATNKAPNKTANKATNKAKGQLPPKGQKGQPPVNSIKGAKADAKKNAEHVKQNANQAHDAMHPAN